MKRLLITLLVLALLASACSLGGGTPPSSTLTEQGGPPTGAPPLPPVMTPTSSSAAPDPAITVTYTPPALPAGPAASPSASISWADGTLAKMTLEAKVGQLLLVGVDGREATPEICDFLAQVRPGGVIFQRGNAYNPSQARRFARGLQGCAETAGGAPLFIAVDHEGEYINRFNEGTTTFPAALAQGATGDPQLARAVAKAAGQELAYSGVNMVLGPVADVLLNSDNEVISQRTFGGDPQQVAAFVKQAVLGYQEAGLIPVLKHFPGHGGVAGDSHKTLPVDEVDRAGLEARYLPPFRSGLAAGAPAVMLAHVAFPQVTGSGEPATLSPQVNRLLRDELGFTGLILSDAMDMKGATGGTIPVEQAALAAVSAGVDQLLIPAPAPALQTYHLLLAAAQAGEIPLETIDASVRRILAVKATVGLTSFPLPEAPKPDWAANDRLAYEVGYRAVTLFKDEAGLLPLPAAAQRILVIAPQADWAFYPALQVALEDSGRQVEFADYPAPWVGPVEDPQALETLPERAQGFDLVLLFTWQVHLNRLLNGDAWQIELAQRLLDGGRPLVVVAIKSPTDLLSLPPVPTYLVMYGSTDGQGQAVLDALTGAAEPSGRNPLPTLGD